MGLAGLEPAASSLSGFCPRARFPRIAPATCTNDVPLETAERIPQATIRLYDGVGHAVSKTHKRRFEDDVLAFVRG